MKGILTFMLTALLAVAASAQNKGYICTYEMTMSLGDKFDALEDGPMKDAIVEQMSKMEMYFTLTFVDGKSLFVLDEERTNNPFAGQAGHTVYIDYNARQQVSQENFFGHAFLIPEELDMPAWQLGTEQQRIADRTCSKATLADSSHTTTAWFSPETPIPAGPMGYWGLPGLIVRLEMEGATYTLSDIKVVDNPKPLNAPTKGKKMSRDEYNTLIQEKLQQMGVGMGGGGGVQVFQMGN